MRASHRVAQATRSTNPLLHPPSRTKLEEALRHCRSAFSTVAVFSLLINLLMLASPIYMLQVYDRVLTTGHIETLIALTCIIGVALFLMSALDSVRTAITVRIGSWLTNQLGPIYLASSVEARLKGENQTAQPLRDLTQIQSFIATQGLTAFFDFPWVPLFIGLLWLLHPVLGITALVTALILLGLSVANEYATRKLNVAANFGQISAMQQAEAAVRNAEAVRAMGMLPAMIERWRAINEGAVTALQSASERSSILIALTKFTRFFAQIAILGLGALLVLRGELSAGSMIAASILLSRALAPVEVAISAWRGFTTARIAYARLQAQLRAYPVGAPRLLLPKPRGQLSVDKLTFSTPETGVSVLRQVSFEVEPGEALAIIGPSAGGKSTLCRFLVGIGTASTGKVRLDGSEIRHWDPEQLGASVGYLPQDVELFSGTVRENIARMGEASDEAVVEAAILAHAHEMIQRLPNGYDTQIGDGGTKLSGGQRQRIGLARAVFGDPRLIVLDEPNANLDQYGETALAAALNELKARGAAIIVVGHRPSTLAQADKILFLKEGRVEIFGSRDEVLLRLREAAAAKASSGAVTTTPARAPSRPASNDETPSTRIQGVAP